MVFQLTAVRFQNLGKRSRNIWYSYTWVWENKLWVKLVSPWKSFSLHCIYAHILCCGMWTEDGFHLLKSVAFDGLFDHTCHQIDFQDCDSHISLSFCHSFRVCGVCEGVRVCAWRGVVSECVKMSYTNLCQSLKVREDKDMSGISYTPWEQQRASHKEASG